MNENEICQNCIFWEREYFPNDLFLFTNWGGCKNKEVDNKLDYSGEGVGFHYDYGCKFWKENPTKG